MDIDIDVVVHVEVEIDVDIERYFGRGSKYQNIYPKARM